MKAIALVFVATAIQTTLSQVSQVVFTERYKGRRLQIPSASVGGSSIDADRTPSDSSTGLETSPRELIEFTSMSFLVLPDAGAGGTMGANSVKSTKSPTVAKSAKGTKSPTAGKSLKSTKSPKDGGFGAAMSFFSFPGAIGSGGTMGANKSVKSTKSPTAGKSVKSTKSLSLTAGGVAKSSKGTKSPTAGKSAKSATFSTASVAAADIEVEEPVKPYWTPIMVIGTAAGASAALVAGVAVALIFKRR